MEECRKTSGIQVSAEPLELSVGGVLKLKLLSCVAQGCFCDTHMQAPLVATRAAARPDATTRGHIHPPLDLAPDEIDIHAIANIPGMIARGTPCEGRAQVVPVRVPAGITRRVVGFPPEEQERVRAHPDPGNATPDGFLVQGSKRLEALHQSQLLEVGGAGRGGGLCYVRVDLACGQDVPIEHKLGLLCRGQPLDCGVIRAPGEHDHHTEQHTSPAYAPWPPSHSISLPAYGGRKNTCGQPSGLSLSCNWLRVLLIGLSS